MTKFGLRRRLLLMALLPSTLLATILVAYFTTIGVHALKEEMHLAGLSTVQYLAPISEYGIIAGQHEALGSLVETSLHNPLIKSAVIVNRKGRILALAGRISLSATQLREVASHPGVFSETERWIAYAAPVTRSVQELDDLFEGEGNQNQVVSEHIGQVFVELDKEELAERQGTLIRRGLAIITVALILIALITVSAADRLAKPILGLSRAVGRMAEGDLEVRVPEITSGEVGVLEHGFNEMAASLQNINASLQSRIEEATAQLAYQARHDMLTGLLNRPAFEQRLEDAFDAVRQGGEPGCVLFIDLDRFKSVNDGGGHAAGDELLRQLALILQERLRAEDTLARIGGDEFAILLDRCPLARAEQIAQDICERTTAYRFLWEEKVFNIGASVGIAILNESAGSIAQILSLGDAACLQAKASGRNQVIIADNDNSNDDRRQITQWHGQLLDLLQTGSLKFEVSPIRNTVSHTAAAVVELGARIHEPGRFTASLPALIDVAERQGIGHELDQRLLEAAVNTLLLAQASRRQLTCFIPVTENALLAPTFMADLQALTNRHEGVAGSLCIVIQEASVTRYLSRVLGFAAELRAVGAHLVLDDFGGGLLPFGNLGDLQPRYVKLSRSLTRQIDRQPSSTALLRAIQEISSDLGIETIAAGIDDSQHISLLASLGIHLLSGAAAGPTEPLDVWTEGAILRRLPADV